MTGWDVSRHPEWDMMYAAGQTVREIADRCHANVAAIHLHLRVKEKHSPGLYANHAAALADLDRDRPSTRWRQHLTEALAFQETHHRLPSSTAGGVEFSLAKWVGLQRNAYRKGSMLATKIVLLDQLEGWKVDVPQQRRDEHWKGMLASMFHEAVRKAPH
ncbi:helicase associated domain-containing protein [Glutamicibacter sp. NPDC087344]|uniref:helicase associated domain-containing protein n=1 Tax=Glutamicibacter sp. NPDC087344 TaxID=3363994 RepID=UPI00382AFA27